MPKREASLNRLSPIALVATLAMVAASVFVGVFGPRLTERSQSALVPLGDVAQQAREIQARMQFEALHRPSGSQNPSRDMIAALCEHARLGGWRPPDLAADGYLLVAAQPVSLVEDEPTVALLYELTDEGADRFLTLLVSADHAQFASFDEFGRIEPFAVGRAIIEPDDVTDPLSSATLVWSDGTLLMLARAASEASLESLRAALGAP